MRFDLIATALLLSAASATAGAHPDDHDGGKDSVILAPGYEVLDFPAPVPGSYVLPDLGAAADGLLLDSGGRDVTLHEVMAGRITVLSFIYRACDDVNGCPLATYVMHQIRQRIETDPDLVDSVRLVSLSFDPLNDTPEAMQSHRDSFGDSPIDWDFVTTRSTAELDPILDAYGQSLNRSDEGEDATINHLLRVYLIDGSQHVRNIFSSSLLHADTLISDIRTLAMERNSATDDAGIRTDGTVRAVSDAASDAASHAASHAASGTTPDTDVPPRDRRAGYATGEYVSRSQALRHTGTGTATDLLSHATSPSLGLPDLPGADALSKESIALGRKLFFDRRLSINDTFSCAMCHVPQQGFTVNEIATAVGVEGRTVKRNAPSLLNIGFLSRLFHDGRESRLEQQVWAPLLAHNEMANPSIGYLLEKIGGIDGYAAEFDAAFGSSQPTMETLGKALSDYQRTLIAGNSPFDRWHFGGDESAVDASVKRGFELFIGKAGCAGCHAVEANHALFTDERLHNTGIGYRRSMAPRGVPHEVTLAPGVVVMVDPASYADAAETPPNDLGRYEVTQNPHDRWKYRTPGLRNVALTAPYMHDGSLESLEQVIDFYIGGGIANELLAPAVKPLSLTSDERAALVSFLESLTSDDVVMLVEDGIAAPRGDVETGAPHWSRSARVGGGDGDAKSGEGKASPLER